jgi:hypothetical protein
VAQDRVRLETHRARKPHDVLGMLLERPTLLPGLIRASVGALIDEHEPELIGEGIEVIRPHRMIEPGPPMQAQDRVALSALDHVDPDVSDVHQPPLTHRCSLLPRPMTAHTAGLPRS